MPGQNFQELTLYEAVHAETTALNQQINDTSITTEPQEGSVLSALAQVELQNLYKTSNPAPSPKEHTDDAANIIYINGLPIVVIADGAFGSSPIPPQIICNTFLPEILPAYVQRLSAGEDPVVVTEVLLREVNQRAVQLNSEYAAKAGAQLTFSFAITYEHEGQIKLATRGTGSDLIVIRRAEQQIYETARAAINLCHPDDVERILSQDQHVPSQKQFLPGNRFETIDEITARNPVSVTALQSGDQIIALSDGAFEFLPLEFTSEARDDETALIKRTLSEASNVIEPANLFAKNIEARDTKVRASAQQHYRLGDDAVCAMATVPALEKRAQIIAKAKEDYAEFFPRYKEKIAHTLEEKYPWGLRIFNCRHVGRREAVCAAIRSANTIEDVQAILSSQSALCSGAQIAAVSETVLSSRWSTQEHLKNIFKANSKYVKAIESAQVEAESFLRDVPSLRR